MTNAPRYTIPAPAPKLSRPAAWCAKPATIISGAYAASLIVAGFLFPGSFPSAAISARSARSKINDSSSFAVRRSRWARSITKLYPQPGTNTVRSMVALLSTFAGFLAIPSPLFVQRASQATIAPYTEAVKIR
jgi:hypothetical protein